MKYLQTIRHRAVAGIAVAAFGAATIGFAAPALAQAGPPPPPQAGPPSAPAPPRGVPPPPPPATAEGAPRRAPGPPGRPGRRRPLVGSIVSVHGYTARISTRDGGVVRLALHPGTVIDPRGTTLVPGMMVAVRGPRQADGSVRADVISLGPPPASGRRGPRRGAPRPPTPPNPPDAGRGGAPPRG